MLASLLLTVVVVVGAWLGPRPHRLSIGAQVALSAVAAVALPLLLILAMLPVSATVALAVYVSLFASRRVAFLPAVGTSCVLGLIAICLLGLLETVVGVYNSFEIQRFRYTAGPTVYLLILLAPLVVSHYRRAFWKRVVRRNKSRNP